MSATEREMLEGKLKHAQHMEAEALARADRAPTMLTVWLNNVEAVRWLSVQLMLQKELRELAHG